MLPPPLRPGPGGPGRGTTVYPSSGVWQRRYLAGTSAATKLLPNVILFQEEENIRIKHGAEGTQKVSSCSALGYEGRDLKSLSRTAYLVRQLLFRFHSCENSLQGRMDDQLDLPSKSSGTLLSRTSEVIRKLRRRASSSFSFSESRCRVYSSSLMHAATACLLLREMGPGGKT